MYYAAATANNSPSRTRPTATNFLWVQKDQDDENFPVFNATSNPNGGGSMTDANVHDNGRDPNFPTAASDPETAASTGDNRYRVFSSTTQILEIYPNSGNGIPLAFGSPAVQLNDPAQTEANTSIYQGYRWRVRARGFDGIEFSTNMAEDIAYRTVLTLTTETLAAGSGRNIGPGDQVWVRGGNTMTTSTITGFPITLEDNWLNLANNHRRAGIRLMHKIPPASGTDNLNNARWQWMTWDMNATAYWTFFLGSFRDNAGTDMDININQVNQYGPLRTSSHMGAWTPLKIYYCLFPGGHRWLRTGQQIGNVSVAYHFNGAFTDRPNLAATICAVCGGRLVANNCPTCP
jgi:hypothetical protein